MKEEIKKKIQDKNVLLVLGSNHTVPPVKFSTLAHLAYYTQEILSDYNISTLSLWDDELKKQELDPRKFQYIYESDFTFKLTKFLFSLVPYRVRKRLLNFTKLDRIAYSFSVYFKLKKLKPDIVVTHLTYDLIKFCKKAHPRGQHVYYFHGSDLDFLSHNQWQFLEENLDGIVSICQAAFDGAEQKFGPSDLLKSVVFNGINGDFFNEELARSKRAEMRKKYNFEAQHIVFLYAGRISKEKGLDNIVDAFQTCYEQNNNIRFLIIGESKIEYWKEESYAQSIKEKLEAFPEGVVQFTGWIPNNELTDAYAAADISVLASLYKEGNSVFLIESMACGLPVIATKVGGIPEVVDNGNTGILVDVDNLTQNLINAYQELIESPERRKVLGDNGIKRVQQKFLKECMASGFEDFLGKLVMHKN
ncbi:glycosyltransferase family 4 protein [Fulvivirgaceae bacterium BMA10]|uniref:Glycosyltransferase family 4 protein n=1 Tax=Splendidivirga corallicola TaxID=3051826 RepID=A0ABT8KQV5_9BACT|nr:glycosyltransferase family 4 protein [Fulvivirgaceae bacterium BMA10]